MTTVIIVEDNTYMRQHFEKMFADDPRYRVVGVFQDAIEAVDACRGGSGKAYQRQRLPLQGGGGYLSR